MTDYAAIFREGRIPPTVLERTLGALHAITAGTSDLLAVRHPLGFLCFPIERQETSGICVHAWSPGFAAPEPPTTSGFHAHSWDLLSLVVFGELQNVRLTVLDGEPEWRVFEVHSSDDGDELRATSRLVRSRKDGCEVNRRGDTYTVQAGCFHATIAKAATTIAVSMARRGARDLSLGAVDGFSHHVGRERCGRVATAHAARLIVDQLSIGLR